MCIAFHSVHCTVDIVMGITEPSLADAVAKGFSGAEDISSTQINQIEWYCRAIFRDDEDSFYQHTEGLLNDAAFASYVTRVTSLVANTGTRVMWKRVRRGFGREFVEFMDKLIAETPVRARPESLTLWKSDLAAERATVEH